MWCVSPIQPACTASQHCCVLCLCFHPHHPHIYLRICGCLFCVKRFAHPSPINAVKLVRFRHLFLSEKAQKKKVLAGGNYEVR